MVNSKKMKKSTVAVILLSLLLCLSLILTATGAWFTAKSDASDAGESTLVFRDEYMSVSVAADNEGKTKVYRDSDGRLTTENYLENGAVVSDAASYDDLMPGDVVVGANVVITFTVGEYDAWYCVKYNNKYYSADGVEITAASGLKKVSETTDNTLTFAATAVQVPENTENGEMGEEFAYSGNVGSLQVFMIQTENIDQATAYAEICPAISA